MDLSSRELRSLKAVHRDQDRLHGFWGIFHEEKQLGFKPVMATLDFTQKFHPGKKLGDFVRILVAMISEDSMIKMLISTEISGFHPNSGGFHHERWGT